GGRVGHAITSSPRRFHRTGGSCVAELGGPRARRRVMRSPGDPSTRGHAWWPTRQSYRHPTDWRVGWERLTCKDVRMAPKVRVAAYAVCIEDDRLLTVL